VLGALALQAVGISLGFGSVETGWWLGGLALLGRWGRTVTTSVPAGGSFAESLRLVPLLATGAALGSGVAASGLGRRGSTRPPAAVLATLSAAVVAAAAGLGLAAATRRVEVVGTQAGTVEVLRGLHPGATAVGAAALAALACGWGLASPRGPARRAWRDARAVLVIPGAVLTTLLALAGAALVLPGPGLPVGLAVLSPLLGSALLLVVGGVPITLALSLVTPEPVHAWLPSAAPLPWLAGLVLLGGLGAGAGVVRGWLEPRTGRGALLSAVAVGAVTGAVLAWTTSVVGVLPPGLGGDVLLVLAPLPAAAVGAALGLLTGGVAGWVSGRRLVRPPAGGQRGGNGERANGNTSVMTTTSPESGSSPSGTLSSTRDGSPAAVGSTAVPPT
jgi:hypothetical protein